MTTETKPTDERIVEVTQVATLPHPYPHARFHGKPVRLMAVGNIEGHSPVFQFIDRKGHVGWASQSQFVLTDPNCLPIQDAADELDEPTRR